MHPRIFLVPLVLMLAALGCASPFSLVSSDTVPDQGQAIPALPSVTPFISDSYPTAGADSISPNQVIGGIDVSVERAWQEGKQVYADVCFTMPDASDWTIWKASLKYADTVVQEYGGTLVSLQEPGVDGQPGQRCDTLEFYVPPDADLSTVLISIESLAAYPREGEYCTIYMPKIQQTLNDRGIAITLECNEANGAATMQITGKPGTMSQEEAEQIVYSDEFFTVKGPWEFTFNLVQ
ncbi:MAG: hypothetical protein WBL25_12240 [Anaerolineales bacterium]